MTTGYSTNATDSAIQANIVAAKYGSTIAVAVDRPAATLAKTRFIASNRSIQIEFSVDVPQQVGVDVLDLQGRTIARVFRGAVAKGSQQAVWDASKAKRGMYCVRLSGQHGAARTEKLLLGE